MKNTHRSLIFALVGMCAAINAQVWKDEYQGAVLTGEDVIGCWKFKPGRELEDDSGHKHALQLRGKATVVSDGKFGGALRCTGSNPKMDNAQGAFLPNAAIYNPDGAFSFDMWVNPDPEIREGSRTYFLVDKKLYHYEKDFEKANQGYTMYLTTASGTDNYYIHVHLGFRTDSVRLMTKAVSLPVGEWHHLAFSYDGAGSLRVFRDGEIIASKHFQDRGPVAPGAYMLTFGDRSGSNYYSFVGRISQIRYCQGLRPEFAGRPVMAFSLGRTVFYHLEKDAKVSLTVNNDTSMSLTDAELQVTVNGETTSRRLKDMVANEIQTVPIPVNTLLKPGSYQLDAVVKAIQDGKPLVLDIKHTYDIVPRQNPFMPVVMWGTGDVEKLKYIGFTHDLHGTLANTGEVWKAGNPVDLSTVTDTSSTFSMLNNFMKEGLHACLTVAPGRWVSQTQTNPEFKRIDRNGKPQNTTNAAVLHPQIQEFGYNVGASSIMTYGQFPNYDAALIHSEVRDNTMLSFQDFEVKSAEKYLGGKIPAEAQAKNGVPYQTIRDFPVNCVIPDDYPLLRFYTWFWKDGDGWNPLHSRIHDGLKSTGRNNFWTFFDPAVRVPSVWGSGGHVDILSQWTYSYPDPIKIGQATDELFAMAEGVPGQQVMKMTQIIWYRSGTAPVGKMPQDEEERCQWERDIPDAQFISIAPDHLSIALWSMLARPVRGIMYHGWGSLFKANHGSYRMTNPETAKRLSTLVHEIVQPLGAMLLQVPDGKADVAILESFSSQMFTQCGSSGWSNGWEADMHLILQWAGYQPRIVYDETIRKNGLDGYQVLVMPNCHVLTQTVYDAIRKFQARGGIVVADERLCPAVMPDVIVPVYARTRKAHVDKQALQEKAAELRAQLEPFVQVPVATSNQDLVARVRRYGTSDYVFVINDKRTYGKYVGQYGLVMEAGLDNAGIVALPPRKAGKADVFVYDLVSHQAVATTATAQGVEYHVALGPGEGKLFLATATPLEKVSVEAPMTAPRGRECAVDIRVTDRRGHAPDAVVPLDVRIRDEQGTELEFSGYHAAVNGKLMLKLFPDVNETPGNWTIQVKDLASGNTASARMALK